jgi:hypothetical protein
MFLKKQEQLYGDSDTVEAAMYESNAAVIFML